MAHLSTRRLTPSRRRSESGQSLLELAIALPVLLALVVGIFEFGLAWNRKQVLTNAAREGARRAVLPSTSQAVVDSVVDAYLTSAGLDPGDVAKTYTNVDVSTSTNDPVTIQLDYAHPFQLLGPILDLLEGDNSIPGTINLTSIVNMRHE